MGGDTIKKILIFLLLGVSLFISSCNLYSNHNHIACSECGRCTDAECDGEVLDKCYKIIPLIFEPSSNKSDLNNFVDKFLNNENFNDSYDWYYNFTNLIPEQITNKYGIAVFKVNKINNLQFTLNIPTICYYIKYKDSIINLADFTNVNIDKFSNESGFLQFSITDCNHDGNIELLLSYFDDGTHLTGIYIYDTASQLIYSEFSKAQSKQDMNYNFFNYDEKNGLCVYTSKSKICSNEITLYKELKGNFMIFDFIGENKIINESFSMSIKFDEKYINFPIYIFKNGILNFGVTVKFEYLGDPKTYYLKESEFEYLNIIFVSQSEEVLRCEKLYVNDYYDFGEFKINNGDIIVKSFDFNINLQGYKDINKICGYNSLYVLFDNREYFTNTGLLIDIRNDGA